MYLKEIPLLAHSGRFGILSESPCKISPNIITIIKIAKTLNWESKCYLINGMQSFLYVGKNKAKIKNKDKWKTSHQHKF